MKGEAQGKQKEQAMRPQKSPKQGSVEIPVAIEEACPESLAQASAIGATVSEAARPSRAEPDTTAQPRLSVPDRQQLISAMIIDEILEADHPARAVWFYVLELDLTPWYDRIRARGRVAGRPAIDPRVLVAVWLYATLSGFSSARELAYLCIHYDPFRWLVGGVSVNYHTLADFRTDNPEFLEPLLKQSVEVLRQQGLIDLDRVAQDGMRVRARAGAASFRRRQTLERLLQEARAEVQRLRQKLTVTATDPITKPKFERGPMGISIVGNDLCQK
jgi:transposase